MFDISKRVQKLIKFIIKCLTKAIKYIDKVIAIYDEASSYIPYLETLKTNIYDVMAKLEDDGTEDDTEDDTADDTAEAED